MSKASDRFDPNRLAEYLFEQAKEAGMDDETLRQFQEAWMFGEITDYERLSRKVWAYFDDPDPYAQDEYW